MFKGCWLHFAGGGVHRGPRFLPSAEQIAVRLGGSHQSISDNHLDNSLTSKLPTPQQKIIMSDAAAPKQVKKATKPRKPKAPAAHPPVATMVVAAITALKERNGSSLAAIKKYMAANYKCDVAKLAPFIRKFLKKAVEDGKLKQIKASYKVDKTKIEKPKKPAKKTTKPKKTKSPKKKAAAKPKKVKTPKKKAAAKPKAAKPKTPKKAAKPKKTKTPKKAAAKPKKTKTPKKKAAKKPAKK